MLTHKLSIPFKKKDILSLVCGDLLLLSGTFYIARDEAHRRLIELKKNNEPLPVDLMNQVIYYCGPAPAKSGQIINSAGPTTAKRMDVYTDDILDLGVIGMIGKGERGEQTRQSLKGRCIYMAALGGVAAKQAKTVLKQDIVAFVDAGMEALRKVEVKNFPVFLINDINGGDYYEEVRREVYKTPNSKKKLNPLPAGR